MNVTTPDYVMARLGDNGRERSASRLYKDLAVALTDDEVTALKLTLFGLLEDGRITIYRDRRGRLWIRPGPTAELIR